MGEPSATDILLGLSLLFGGHLCYGIIVLATCWLPLPVLVIHMRHQVYEWFEDKGPVITIVSFLLLFPCFPILPIVLYIAALSVKSNSKQLLSTADSVKSIIGMIEAPIQIVVVFMLMLNGVLHFPWDKEANDACLEDHLDRKVGISLVICGVSTK